MKEKVNWIWHYLSNNVVCQECGKHERNYPDYICDAHTHGMNLYGHPEFQVVIDYGAKELGRLLNEMGRKVRDGQRFKHGDRISGLYLDCDIELREMPDVNGQPLLRMIIPDKQNRWPEASDYPHNLQILATSVLSMYGKIHEHGEENDDEEYDDCDVYTEEDYEN